MNYKNIFAAIFLLAPALVSAQYNPLVGIPGLSDPNTDMNTYINALYALAIAVAALLAVIKIIIAGVKWMLSDIVTSKQEAKSDIWGATIGLLLVISAVLIFSTINPQLTETSLFVSPVGNPTDNRPTDSSFNQDWLSPGDTYKSLPNTQENRSSCDNWKYTEGADNGWCITSAKTNLYRKEIYACATFNGAADPYIADVNDPDHGTGCTYGRSQCTDLGGTVRGIPGADGQILTYQIKCE